MGGSEGGRAKARWTGDMWWYMWFLSPTVCKMVVLDIHAPSAIYTVWRFRSYTVYCTCSICISLVLPTEPVAGEGKPEASDRSDVNRVLGRLRLENGQSGPRGYQQWMTTKLDSRFLVENDMPGDAALCNPCQGVLTHSLGLMS